MTHPILSLRKLGATVLENEPMSAHTTFKIGGPARFFVEISAECLPLLACAARECGLPLMLIGNGSNLLVSDSGFAGVIARLEPGIAIAFEQTLSAAAGCKLSAAALTAAKAGLSGLEFAHGIPGTVGGGIYMNAGAYGGQISDVLQSCDYIDLSNAENGAQTLSAADMAFGYRESIFKSNPEWVIISAHFELQSGEKNLIEQKMCELASSRREKQPLNLPSAGSVYKRPEGFFAGKLIEDCGLKGLQIGGAQVSEIHAGFIVNRGGATCRDVLELMERIESEVFARFGVRLEREVRVTGEL